MSKWPMVPFTKHIRVYQPETIALKALDHKGQFPVFGANGKIGVHSEYNHEEVELLLGCRGSVGSVNWSEPRSWINGNAMVVRPDAEFFDREFVGHLLSSGWDLAPAISGTAQPQITRASLNWLSIPLPPLDEQKRIVAKMDEASELIARHSALNQLRREQLLSARVSILNHAFANDEAMVNLASLCEVITDGDHQPPPKSDTGIPFITISCIDKVSRRIDFEAGFRVSSTYFEALQESRKPRRGDVLLTVTGSYGIPVIVRDDRPFCFQRHIALIRPKPEVSAEWLSQVLRTSSVRAQIEDGATGTAQKTLSLRALRALRVPQWSTERQLETSQMVHRLEEYLDASVEYDVLRQAQMTSLRERIIFSEISGAA